MTSNECDVRVEEFSKNLADPVEDFCRFVADAGMSFSAT